MMVKSATHMDMGCLIAEEPRDIPGTNSGLLLFPTYTALPSFLLHCTTTRTAGWKDTGRVLLASELEAAAHGESRQQYSPAG